MARNSATSFDKDISMEIKNDEELLWRGAPKKSSFVLSKSVALLPIALIWICFDGFGIFMLANQDLPKGAMIGIAVFFAFHLLPVWMWIYSIISAISNHKKMEYAFTNERIIVREKGELKSYYYKNLRKTHVKVGLIDKLFKVGDISVTGRKSVTLLDLENPYAVSDKLQQFIDVKREKYLAEHPNNDEESEEYYENDEYGYFDDEDEDDNVKDYSENEYQLPKSASFTANGRFTSKKQPTPNEKTQEDEYLDNIMNSINKKDEF